MHNRFRQPFETKFGIKPPMSRINFNTLEKTMETALPMVINAPQPIWEVLGITELEYYEKYHTQPISDNALEIQEGIGEEKTQEAVIEPLEELPQDVPDVPVS
jgi:hypothetical protein